MSTTIPVIKSVAAVDERLQDADWPKQTKDYGLSEMDHRGLADRQRKVKPNVPESKKP